jgi:hypothetical protein
MAKVLQGRLRRIMACVLAYALALQGLLFAVDVGRAATAAADGTPLFALELCAHGGSGAALPGAPAPAPAGDAHCPFCIVGAVYVHGVLPVPPQYIKVPLRGAVWPLSAPRLVALAGNRSAWPRGPPTAA